MDLSKYKDIFGRPNEGVHKTRFLNMAFYDLLGLVLVSVLINSYNGNKLLSIDLFYIIIIMFILAIFLHRIFHVNTTINKKIFGIV